MSGRRCKALRRAFLAVARRTPTKTTWRSSFDAYIPSEWRRLKKAALRARRAGLPFRVMAPPPVARRRRASL